MGKFGENENRLDEKIPQLQLPILTEGQSKKLSKFNAAIVQAAQPDLQNWRRLVEFVLH